MGQHQTTESTTSTSSTTSTTTDSITSSSEPKSPPSPPPSPTNKFKTSFKMFKSSKKKETNSPLASSPSHNGISGISMNNTAIPASLPKTSDGLYTQNFTLDQLDEIKTFFEKYGFVVVRNVLSEQEIEQSIEEIWRIIEGTDDSTKSIIESLRQFHASAECVKSNAESNSNGNSNSGFTPVQRNDPTTWREECGWPEFDNVGILGNQPAMGICAMENRQNENIYRIFNLLMNNCNKLWVGFDTYGVMKPTKDVLCKDGKTRKDFPQYKTKSNWLHWRLNPWKLYKQYQTLNTNLQKHLNSSSLDLLPNLGTQNSTFSEISGSGTGGLISSPLTDHHASTSTLSNFSEPSLSNGKNSLISLEIGTSSGKSKKKPSSKHSPCEKAMHCLKSSTPRKFLLNEDYGIFPVMDPNAYTSNPAHDYLRDEWKLQGLINFVDSREQDGGLMLVPSFHAPDNFLTWTKATYKRFGTLTEHQESFIKVPLSYDLYPYAKAISLPAGALLVWDSRIPTCTYPNDSDRFHMVQYIRMFKCEKYMDSSVMVNENSKTNFFEMRRQLILQQMPREFVPSPIGKKVFGLEEW